MKKRSKAARWIITAAIVLVVLALAVRYVPTNFLLPAESDFSLSATDVPDTMKVGETLTPKIALHYPAWRSFVATDNGFVVFAEFDRAGDDTPHGYAMPAYHHYFPAGGQWEIHDVTSLCNPPAEPGEYVLRVYTDFSIGGQKYHLTLPEKTITVTE